MYSTSHVGGSNRAGVLIGGMILPLRPGKKRPPVHVLGVYTAAVHAQSVGVNCASVHRFGVKIGLMYGVN